VFPLVQVFFVYRPLTLSKHQCPTGSPEGSGGSHGHGAEFKGGELVHIRRYYTTRAGGRQGILLTRIGDKIFCSLEKVFASENVKKREEKNLEFGVLEGAVSDS
jgi:hypothetical protein